MKIYECICVFCMPAFLPSLLLTCVLSLLSSQYTEYITPLDPSRPPELAPPKSDADAAADEAETAAIIEAAESSLAAFSALNLKLREDTAQRMADIISAAEQNNKQLRESWAQREEARLAIEKQNASLAFLLDRAAEAKAKVFAPTEDPKAKGAKGKKK